MEEICPCHAQSGTMVSYGATGLEFCHIAERCEEIRDQNCRHWLGRIGERYPGRTLGVEATTKIGIVKCMNFELAFTGEVLYTMMTTSWPERLTQFGL